MPKQMKAAFSQASTAVRLAFDNQQIYAEDAPAPAQLIAAIQQFFVLYEKLDAEIQQNPALNKDSISEIGEQTIHCLSDLSVWADKLELSQEKAILDEVTLAVAHWIIQQRAEIRTLDTIGNLLAAKANTTSDPGVLKALFHVMGDVLEYASPELKLDQDKTDPSRPWRMLNFNFAIIATRTMNKDLMARAFDTLGRNLPEDCPQFFEEGLHQSEKAIYGPEIKSMMAEYFKKWAILH